MPFRKIGKFNPTRLDEGFGKILYCSFCKKRIVSKYYPIPKEQQIWSDAFTIEAKRNTDLCEKCCRKLEFELGGKWKDFDIELRKLFKRIPKTAIDPKRCIF